MFFFMTHIFIYLLVEHRTITSRAEFCNSSNLVRKADLTRVDVPSEPLDSPLFESNPSHSSMRRQHGWKAASSWNTLKFSFSLLNFFQYLHTSSTFSQTFLSTYYKCQNQKSLWRGAWVLGLSSSSVLIFQFQLVHKTGRAE